MLYDVLHTSLWNEFYIIKNLYDKNYNIIQKISCLPNSSNLKKQFANQIINLANY